MGQKPNYGMDAPAIVYKFGIIGVILLAFTMVFSAFVPSYPLWTNLLLSVLVGFCFMFLMPAITIPLGSYVFKFRDREWLFRNLKLRGDESVLDVGCGHGLLLIGAAKRLAKGKATGLDLWNQSDQAGNSSLATRKNADLEGVLDRIEIANGDMREMPFASDSFDAVVSSWAIHNIYSRAERERALEEIVRVLRPGGKVAILDIDHAKEYFEFFYVKNFASVKILGPRFTFGNRTYLVLAQKPSAKA